MFELPEGGPEPLLKALIDGGAGIEALSIERPGLHDAFVAIAGEAAAGGDGRPETGRMMRFIRSAWVIARRDFTATVLSKTFLFFLLGPLFPLLFAGVFGVIGARVASEREKPVVAVVAAASRFCAGLGRARPPRRRDRRGHGRRLARFAPEPDRAAQRKRLLGTGHPPIQAVLTGGSASRT